ncbi:extracellular solute-binding protein [Serinicoccus kebangsaanensis]|uniref:extracellular solute-binding protein n=1 Tax=Serinicoccus kebangsaanensis TaxID=2602069 RepID=UPI00124D0016|nr:extracellular solute-binding protein [Serinicoccus kebangsaanensis]
MKHITRTFALAATGVLTLSLAACGGEGFEDDGGGDGEAGQSEAPASADGPASLQMLIASSGDAETQAVEEAAAAWAEDSGNTVDVTVASDMGQELAQGFAGGSPADVFYLDAGAFATNAEAGNLYAYEAEDNDDFYEPLREAFTYEDQQYCAPKDFSTLGLIINQSMWEEAGLTEDDLPTTYDELAQVAETLTTGDVTGLVLSPGIDRAGAFVVGSGGWWMNEDNTAPTANTPEVVAGLQVVQDMISSGSAALSSQVDTGWGGEAFGTGRAAMTIEGNWIKGAMSNDYPDLDYLVAELPEGPAGPGTLLFTQCWGVAAQSEAQAQAVELVNYLTSAEQQMAFADAFGVMPSRQSASEDYTAAYPEDEAFIAGGDYGHGPINVPGIADVVADLNSQLENIGSADLESVVESFDSNVQAVLGR